MFAFQNRAKLRITPIALCKITTVRLAQRTYARVASLVADFTIPIPATIIETRVAMSFRHKGPPDLAITIPRSLHLGEQSGNIMVRYYLRPALSGLTSAD